MSKVLHATLIGGHGFVGRHLDAHLRSTGWLCDLIARNDMPILDRHYGHVFYCAGLTADFRQRPFDTVEAHVSYLAHWLQAAKFDSLTYLSSTRVYANASSTAETSTLLVNPELAGDLYNLSKLMGESLCLQSGRPVKIARLSNVYGEQMPSQNFLSEILSAAARLKTVEFFTAPESEKDYISVKDVALALPRIALVGESGIFNLASGKNISNQMIADFLTKSGVICAFQPNAPAIKFPRIETKKVESLFGMKTCDLVQDLPSLLQHYGEAL
ncbi:SDR family oxidoreductase [Undibacterium amnicola]|uniref:SDR family oxidoreductase n=1 Tax=Undibacterium amnicola TaxID=1834038 RepID=A0ABR6XLF8_9BURK|nr:SDR family oxidoreductase [Undibacterium amnicola]MBC3830236.1 SDR family oxidoreductase [Undibacterium amnicola]